MTPNQARPRKLLADSLKSKIVLFKNGASKTPITNSSVINRITDSKVNQNYKSNVVGESKDFTDTQ